jgi:hypothetical protein
MAGLLVSNASDSFLTAMSFWILAVLFCFVLYYLPSLWLPGVAVTPGVSKDDHTAAQQ